MKKTKSLCVVFLVVLFSAVFAFTAFGAEEKYVEGIFTYTVEDGKATIVKCVWETGDELVIPEELGGYPVVAIGDGAFTGETHKIREIRIPSSLERIGKKNYARNAYWIHVEKIEDWLDIEFADDNFGTLSTFAISIGGEYVDDLIIPEGITEIKPYAFNRCVSIDTVTLPKGFKKIGAEAFTDSKVKKVYVDSFETWNSIDMQDIPMKIAKELYIGGELVTAIDVPESVTVLNCQNLSYLAPLDYLKIHGNVSEIYGGMAGTKIRSLYIDSLDQYINTVANSVRYTSDGTAVTYNVMSKAEKIYIGGELVTELVIPEGVTEIPYGCFKGTKGISRISLPFTLEKIGGQAFYNMADLTAVSVPDAETWFRICDDLERSVVGKSFDKLYINGVECNTFVIPDSVETLPKQAFFLAKSIKNVVMSKNIKNFNEGFYNCPRLESIYVDSLEIWLGYKFDYYLDNPMHWAEKLYVDGELLTDVVIPDGTTEIGYGLHGIEHLESVTIPASVTKIKKDAFMGCEGLKAVYAESLEAWLNIDFETPESNPLYYGAKLYIDGKLLTEVTLPEKMSAFRSYTFYGCESLKKINITKNVKSFNKGTFTGCTNASVYADTLEHWLSFEFTEETTPMASGKNLYIAGKALTKLTVPEGTKKIPDYAFAYVKNLTKVEIPASTVIGRYAFRNSGVKVAVIGTLPKGQTQATAEIKQYGGWFSGCSDIELIIGPGIRKIGYQAFSGCVAIKKITFSYGVETIGDQAFKASPHLKEVVISSSVKSVGESAFYNSPKLESVTFGDRIGGKPLAEIGRHAFYKCSALKNVTFNTCVSSFREAVFKECRSIENVYVNDFTSYLAIKNREMDDYASSPVWFADNLYINGKIAKNVVIPEGVTRINDYAFYGVKSLETVQFPSTLKEIGAASFSNCINLRDVVFPDSILEIGDFAFFSCNNIKSIEIPKSVKWIGMGTFEYCKKLEYIVLYEGGLKLGMDALMGCESLKQILYTGTDEKWMTFVSKNLDSGVANVPSLCGYNPETFFSPDKIKATQTVNSITLSWNEVEGVTGYRVYVKDRKTNTWNIVVKSTGKKTTATINNLIPGTKYTFAVRAYMNTGSLIIWSPGFSEHNTLTKPSVTDKVTASQKTDCITLKWNKVAGATGYRVYVVRNGKWKALKTTTGLTYTATGLNSGTKYTFAVKAYTKHDGNTYWASKYAKFITSTRTATPCLTKITAYTGKAKLTWSDVSGESDYQVWYSTSKDGTYKRFGNAKANATSMTVTGLTSAKTYYFKVRAYIKTDSGYVYSAWSAVKSVKVK